MGEEGLVEVLSAELRLILKIQNSKLPIHSSAHPSIPLFPLLTFFMNPAVRPPSWVW